MSLDGPIRSALASRDAKAAADPCPSPEVFAAYYEHSLDPEETERYDAHIASCASCRATLAGVARASLGDSAALRDSADVHRASRWNWRRLSLWLVPATAAACAIFIVLGVHQRSTATHEQAAQVAELRSAPAPSSESLPAAPPPAAIASQPSAAPDVTATLERKQREVLPAPKMPEVPARSAPKPAPSPLSASANSGANADAASATVQVAPEAEASAAAPAPPLAQRNARQQSMQSFSAGSASALSKSRKAAAGPQQAAAKDHLTIAAPDSSITWTIHTNHVQYTENGQAAPVQDFLPTNSAIAAGSAPGGKTCWLVGSGGAVVRTIDARNWLAATPPTSADLTAITAQNARAATVTAADGKTYSTTDAGATWKAAQPQ
jgi:Putative zinc-finger